MKLATKSAGIFGSGAIIVTVYVAFFFNAVEPYYVVFLSVSGGLLLGFLGYQLGAIWDNPKGPPPKPKIQHSQPSSAAMHEGDDADNSQEPATDEGDESSEASGAAENDEKQPVHASTPAAAELPGPTPPSV